MPAPGHHRSPRYARRLLGALGGAVAMVVVTACGSAGDLSSSAERTPSEPPVRTLPPTTAPPSSAAPSPTTPPVVAPKVGECRKAGTMELALRVSDDDAQPVACAGATSVTYAVTTMPAAVSKAVTAYDTKKIVQAAYRTCEKQAASYLGTSTSTFHQSQFGFVVGVPSAGQSAEGATWMRCDLVLPATATKLGAIPAKTKNALKGSSAKRYMQCVRGDIRGSSGTVPCSTKHQWRAVESVRLADASKGYPKVSKLEATLKDRCGTAVRKYLGTRNGFDYGYVAPGRGSWERGDRWGVCFAKTKK